MGHAELLPQITGPKALQLFWLRFHGHSWVAFKAGWETGFDNEDGEHDHLGPGNSMPPLRRSEVVQDMAKWTQMLGRVGVIVQKTHRPCNRVNIGAVLLTCSIGPVCSRTETHGIGEQQD